jgi:Holliday junction DNA helicase RuvA
MFEFLRGIISEKTPSTLVLDVNGVGYLLNIPFSTAQAIGDTGAHASILVHFYVREDTQRLYGFATSSERDAFRELIGISQVGPKVAMSVLSGISVKDLAAAVARGDVSKFKSVQGVGPKTAQRLIVELKGKLTYKDTDGSGSSFTPAGKDSGVSGTERDAYDAMIALGYSESLVMRAVARVKETVAPETAVEEWIRRALQVI